VAAKRASAKAAARLSNRIAVMQDFGTFINSHMQFCDTDLVARGAAVLAGA